MAVTPNDGYVRVLSTLKSANDSFFVVNATDIGYYEYVNEDGIPSGDLMNLQQKIQSLLLTNETMEQTKEELSEAIKSVDGNVKELSTTVSDNKAETDKSISSINNEINTIKTNIENLDTNISNTIKENYDTLNTSITTTDGKLETHIGKHIGRQGQKGLFSERFNDYEHNISNGDYSHAEGYGTYVAGKNSHAEGSNNKIYETANSAHVEGNSNNVYGQYSHAEGYGHDVYGYSQHVEGMCARIDSDMKYIHIAGNGNIPYPDNSMADGFNIKFPETIDSNGRSNAYTLDWYGNGWFAGDVTIGNYSLSMKDTIDRLDRIKYYGNENIYPTDESLFEFTLNEDESGYDITGNYFIDNNITDVVIPYKYNGKPVVSITGINMSYDGSGVYNNHLVKSMIVPSTITEIPNGAFEHNGNLETLILPDTITHIHDYAFSSCQITNFKFPKNLEYIGVGVLSGITDNEIYIPETVTHIGDFPSQEVILVVEKDSYADNLIYTHNHSSQYDNPLETPDGILFKYTKDFTIKSVLKAGEWINPGVITGYDKPTYDLGTDGGAYRYLVYPSQTMDISVSLDALDCTQEQYEAFNNAQLVGAYNTNEVIAFGDMPKIDIPVILKVVMK